MGRKWIHLFLLTSIVVILSACSQTVEEQAQAGMENAETIFSSETNEANKTIGHIELYLPKGYSIEKGIDELNYTILNGKDSYILFVNQNEPEDSRLQYDLLKQENKNEIVEEKTFEEDGHFGFSAVTKLPEEKYELIVNIGGVKLSTISEDKKMDDKIKEMMEIVKSVKVVN
ncbi:hypothetical protein MKY51_12755 [Solibacillus sp. FSL R5-0691]|uniref:hypothetical protein n=1 Tax=unclassified Solibacillus TaxID=2637870 RepID=UPI0030D3CCC5